MNWKAFVTMFFLSVGVAGVVAILTLLTHFFSQYIGLYFALGSVAFLMVLTASTIVGLLTDHF